VPQRLSRFDHRVIAALHLPDPVERPGLSRAWLEDYALTNSAIFASSGIPAIKLQDQTRESGPASLETVTRMAALARLIRREFPALGLGVIVQAHDAAAPLAIAAASGADFVRLKVYVGAVMSSEGPKSALCVAARASRASLGADDVAILADIHDRTSAPIGEVSQARAAQWAKQMAADGLVITGDSFDDTLARIAAIRAAAVKGPILIGGGVDAGNVARALEASDGVIVSSSLMLRDRPAGSVAFWDKDACRRLMDAARPPSGENLDKGAVEPDAADRGKA
jgi:predicted TIM-barrel enzyme